MINGNHIDTWIFQVCKICAFSPTKTYQKAEILHILLIQVYIVKLLQPKGHHCGSPVDVSSQIPGTGAYTQRAMEWGR